MRILNEHADISLSQWRVMVMMEQGETTASEIVRKSKIDKALISRTIKGLIERGLIEAATDAKDQRTQRLQFTPAGLETFNQAYPHMLARQNGLVEKMSAAEVAAFFKAISQLEAAIDRMDPET
jgi:DNA-binding MarR family transcriptional regulator